MFSDVLMLTFFVLTFTSSAEDMVMVPFNSSMNILLARVVCNRIVWAVSSKVTVEPLRVVRLFLWLAARPPLPVTPLNRLPKMYGLAGSP
jgi:hypothetical protein